MRVHALAEALLASAEMLGLAAWAEHGRSSSYVVVLKAGRTATIRVSDHATVSHRHPPADCNVAPGRETAEAALALLEAIALSGPPKQIGHPVDL